MKNNMFKGLVSILLIGFLVTLIANINVSEGADGNIVIKGTIVSVSTITGQVVIKTEEGENVNLAAGHEIDLTIYSEGDHVTVEHTKDGIVRFINKGK